ncbi:ethanolamine ammonia-lyase subunit EutC [Desulfosporosinus sp.]|uniref:ethanolamine ammonia-lyase subunit EutC n=1 Tax=Desulfosporosinus sp. TaxID=157907 RepID=UPI002315CD4D|nr:ethanolamine ammonia-lyase subunit EutC [Desulfosporosinus sp.]MCO5387331.1 ethanolamine ammonia-lyase subunit EutC [Desulfosporosinus sp.]MDA8221642.1 ethanolamine ammonia-lyase subunit EutC [Desulfitobacterium hafniense]
MAVANNELEKVIIQSVMEELAKKGLLSQKGKDHVMAAAMMDTPLVPNTESEEMVTFPPQEEMQISNPFNADAVRAMKKLTPARIGIGRAGTRPKTISWLRFLADHAVAQDAVFLDVSEGFLQRMNLMSVQSAASSKDQFLQRPDLGRRLSVEAVKTVSEKCEKNVQVQILIVDGLSSSAIEANIPDLLPALMQGLKSAGIKVGAPFFVKNGRVWIQDHVASIVNSDLIISLIGERPGLGTAESLSAYMIYRPNENTVEADRTVISNIHKGGIPPAEAGAHLTDVIKQILAAKASGVKLNQQK